MDTPTPMKSMLLVVTTTPAPMELEIKPERIAGSVAKPRTAGKFLGRRRPAFTDFQVYKALRLIKTRESG